MPDLDHPVLVPDLSASLSDGVVVRADVRARLLGMRLLRLHAAVVLVPATTVVPGQVVTNRHDSDRMSTAPSTTAAPVGTLRQARQLLAQSEDLLDTPVEDDVRGSLSA